MVDEALDVSVKLLNDQVADLRVTVPVSKLHRRDLIDSPLLHKLGDQKLGVFALGQCPELALELARNHAPLLHGRVFDGRLNDAYRVVLEDKVLDSSGDNLEQLRDKLLPLLLLDVRL
jgi:hypothetical protein